MFSTVYLRIIINVYPCLLVFTNVYSFLPMFAPVYSCFPLFTCVYVSFPRLLVLLQFFSPRTIMLISSINFSNVCEPENYN